MRTNVWELVNELPLLSEGEIHVWCADLNGAAVKIQQGLTILSSEEKEKAARFVRPEHRERYINSHALLRNVLSRYTKIPAEDLPFHRHAQGKPYLANSSMVRFNMSHSESLAIFAIAWNQEVGVDVEYVRLNVHPRDIVERFFSATEQAAFQSLPE